MINKSVHLIEWLDHFQTNGWHDSNSLDKTPMLITSIGFLTGETDDVISLSSTIDEEDQANYTITILQKCIEKHEIIDWK